MRCDGWCATSKEFCRTRFWSQRSNKTSGWMFSENWLTGTICFSMSNYIQKASKSGTMQFTSQQTFIHELKRRKPGVSLRGCKNYTQLACRHLRVTGFRFVTGRIEQSKIVDCSRCTPAESVYVLLRACFRFNVVCIRINTEIAPTAQWLLDDRRLLEFQLEHSTR